MMPLASSNRKTSSSSGHVSTGNNFIENKFCQPLETDFRIYNVNKNLNYGYDNSCEKPGELIWFWNDVGTVGCSYTCIEETCDKLEPASARGFTLLNSEYYGNGPNFLAWVRDSSYSALGSLSWPPFSMSWESIVEYELDVPDNKDKLNIVISFLS